ncbi:hypothetical protein K438DRAFT_1914816 [Mycena galopus ATCC 62051]|nr:hypothetical protein K438DRAFT_1914816 [Mycena galopus ATCC 62051]
MSFQHFRLSEAVVPLQQHLHTEAPVASTSSIQQFQANSTFPTNHIPVGVGPASTKAPYGSGDTDDGYTLVFPNLEAFHEWRQKRWGFTLQMSEEEQMVEFVKGDTHGNHTKLVCARHSRSGRKKYVKKHPERVRKVPSRKLEGDGCGASISFKTYFDSDEVRACYISQHSHEIGLANFPFTRRGRKAAVEQDKQKSRKQAKTTHPSSAGSTSQNGTTSTPATQNKEHFSNAISMLAPLPAPYQPVNPAPGGSYFSQPAPAAPPAEIDTTSLSHDRWENMATLFESVRGHARTFEYPSASVAALETVLIRLYLESPLPRTTVVTNRDPISSQILGRAALRAGRVLQTTTDEHS